MSNHIYKVGDVIEFASALNGTLIEATVTEVMVNTPHVPIKGTYTSPKSGTVHNNSPIYSSLIKRVITPAVSPNTYAYKVGDRVRFNKKTIIYEIESIGPGDHYYGYRQSGTSYTRGFFPAFGTHLVSPTEQVGADCNLLAEKKQVDTCEWSTKQPIDVEPLYYRIYNPDKYQASLQVSNQKGSSEALVIKHASRVITAVPFCSKADKYINIIGLSVKEGDRWKASAYLYCEHCGSKDTTEG